MSANPITSWLKKWGLWILLGVIIVLVVLAKLLPSNGEKPRILQQAKDAVAAAKKKTNEELAELTKAMDARSAELEEIKKIESEDERLKRLADFANRGTS